jgi:hypothetical protein
MLLKFHDDKGDKNDDNFDKTVENKGSFGYLKFYNTSEHLAIDEVTTFQREGCIQAVYPKETQMFRN